jgi:hypothetical protein
MRSPQLRACRGREADRLLRAAGMARRAISIATLGKLIPRGPCRIAARPFVFYYSGMSRDRTEETSMICTPMPAMAQPAVVPVSPRLGQLLQAHGRTA